MIAQVGSKSESDLKEGPLEGLRSDSVRGENGPREGPREGPGEGDRPYPGEDGVDSDPSARTRGAVCLSRNLSRFRLTVDSGCIRRSLCT